MFLYTRNDICLHRMLASRVLYVLIQNKRDTFEFSRLRQTQFAVFHAWSEFPTFLPKRREFHSQITFNHRQDEPVAIAYGVPHRNLRAFCEHEYATIIPHAYPPSFWKENTFSCAEHRGDASQLPLMNARIHLHSKCNMQWSTKEIDLPK